MDGPTKKLKKDVDSASVERDLKYRIVKGSSIQDARLSMHFLVPTTFAESVFKILEGSMQKEMEWSLSAEELPAEVALTLPSGLAITVVPTFPALFNNAVGATKKEEAGVKKEDAVDLEEVDAVEILKTPTYDIKRNHLIYYVYDHKRPYASWKAALKIDKEEHMVIIELLERMVRGRENFNWGECNQVVDVQLWSEAKVARCGFSKCPPPVTDDIVQSLRDAVVKDGENLIDWNSEFALVSESTSDWYPDY